MKHNHKKKTILALVAFTLIVQIFIFNEGAYFVGIMRPATTAVALTANYNMRVDMIRRLLDSECTCHAEKSICLRIEANDDYNITISDSGLDSISYKMSRNEFEHSNMACHPYSVLRRGLGQKIIAYSIANNPFNATHLKSLIQLGKKYFPAWTIRIYHNGTISKAIQCEFECLIDRTSGKLYDNIDFCNINELTYVAMDATNLEPSAWRWLPVGDLFVDYFLSRDFDSCPGEREYLAVNEWLQSNNLFHIIRGIGPLYMRTNYFCF